MNQLPEVWRRFLARVVPTPPDAPRGARIAQRGELRLESGRWLPFTAEQWFAATESAFCWHARARMAPLVTVVVEDAYEGGHGRLDATVLGIIPVAHGAPGPALDRGELVRYLAEIAWNPLALLYNPELRFATAPDGRPRLWARDEASYVDFTFDADGDLREVGTLTRNRGDGPPTPWSARYLAYGELGGARVPVQAEVSWDPPEGRQVYWRASIEAFDWR